MISKLKKLAKRIPVSFLLFGTYRMLRYSKKSQKLQIKYPLRILNSYESVNYIEKGNFSVGRFGDGEFDLMFDGRENIGFQKNDQSLVEALFFILRNPKPNFVIGLPYMFVDVRGFKFWVSSAWRYYNTKFLRPVANIIDNENLYVATGFTRPYFEYKDLEYTKKIIDSYSKLWKNKNILIVEGESTRFGVGNSLLTDAKNIKRILAPSENAWSKKNKLKEHVLEYLKDKKYDDWVILIALGPTATVLAYELSDYVQCIDAGHMDLHFEYFSHHSKKVEKIEGKYANEAIDGQTVDSIYDEKYIEQIIDVIK